MFAGAAIRKNDNVVIVDSCDFMRRVLKNMISVHNFQILEASGTDDALSLTGTYDPGVVFISMEGIQNWPNLAKCIKSRGACRVVAYSTGITRDAVASAHFAGVDEILVSPQNQKERLEKCLTASAGVVFAR